MSLTRERERRSFHFVIDSLTICGVTRVDTHTCFSRGHWSRKGKILLVTFESFSLFFSRLCVDFSNLKERKKENPLESSKDTGRTVTLESCSMGFLNTLSCCVCLLVSVCEMLTKKEKKSACLTSSKRP